MKKYYYLITGSIFFILIFFACKDMPPAQDIGIDRAHPLVKMIDFTAARVSDNDRVTRSLNDVERVGIGVVAGQEYDQQVFLQPIVTKTGASYYIRFDTVLAIHKSALTTVVRLRLYLTSGKSIDIDTTIFPYRYPYENTELVLPPSDIAYKGAIVQDIAFSKGIMYILHLGDDRIFRRAPDQHSIQFYKRIMEMDFLAGDSSFLFIDNLYYIARLNTELDSIDLVTRRLPYSYFFGIAAENGKVYVVYPDFSLVLFDYEGNLIDSMAIRPSVSHIAVSDGILFTNKYADNTIGRFDTRTRSNLPDLKYPTLEIEGMEIYKGYLYYGDYNRRAVMRIHLTDLVEVGTAQ